MIEGKCSCNHSVSYTKCKFLTTEPTKIDKLGVVFCIMSLISVSSVDSVVQILCVDGHAIFKNEVNIKVRCLLG